MAALAVDRRREEDDEELFRLYRDVFGHEMTEASRRRWAWQYRDNPRSDGAPEIWVAVTKPGRMIFEMEGVTPEVAKQALNLAGSKLSLTTQIRTRGVGRHAG